MKNEPIMKCTITTIELLSKLFAIYTVSFAIPTGDLAFGTVEMYLTSLHIISVHVFQ